MKFYDIYGDQVDFNVLGVEIAFFDKPQLKNRHNPEKGEYPTGWYYMAIFVPVGPYRSMEEAIEAYKVYDTNQTKE